jgi:hypothetical protein
MFSSTSSTVKSLSSDQSTPERQLIETKEDIQSRLQLPPLTGAQDTDDIVKGYLFDQHGGVSTASFDAVKHYNTVGPTLFEHQLFVTELVRAVMNAQYNKVQEILEKASRHLPLLEKLLTTPMTVVDLIGRKHVNKTAYQLALGAKDYDVVIRIENRDIKIIKGIVELITSYFDKLNHGVDLCKKQHEEHKSKYAKENEQLRAKKDSEELHRIVDIIATASEADCRQTMALDSFHGYDLDNLIPSNEVYSSAVVYLENRAAGMNCHFIALDGKVKTKLVPWHQIGMSRDDFVSTLPSNGYRLVPMGEETKALIHAGTFQPQRKEVPVEILANGDLSYFSPQTRQLETIKKEELTRDCSTWYKLQDYQCMPLVLSIMARKGHILSKYTCLPNILEQLAEPGIFYTPEQMQHLKRLSHATVKALSNDAFETAWNELQQYIQSIVGNAVNFTLLKALYHFRNYLEPRGICNTITHCNAKLLPEAYQLYHLKFKAMGGAWYSPRNVLICQNIIGLIQRLLPACEMQFIAQSPYRMFRKGEESKRSLLVTEDGSASLPHDTNPIFRLGYNGCLGMDEYDRHTYTRALGTIVWMPPYEVMEKLISCKDLSAAKLIEHPVMSLLNWALFNK